MLVCILSQWKHFFSPRLANRNDFDVSVNVKSSNEMIPTNISIYKQGIQHSEADKTVGAAGCGLISQAEKSVFSIAWRLSFHLGDIFTDTFNRMENTTRFITKDCTSELQCYDRTWGSKIVSIGCHRSTLKKHNNIYKCTCQLFGMSNQYSRLLDQQNFPVHPSIFSDSLLSNCSIAAVIILTHKHRL